MSYRRMVIQQAGAGIIRAFLFRESVLFCPKMRFRTGFPRFPDKVYQLLETSVRGQEQL